MSVRSRLNFALSQGISQEQYDSIYENEVVRCRAVGCHHHEVGKKYECEKEDIKCAYRNRDKNRY